MSEIKIDSIEIRFYELDCSDTLLLVGSVRDYGEFGGHAESIIVTCSKNQWKANLKIYNRTSMMEKTKEFVKNEKKQENRHRKKFKKMLVLNEEAQTKIEDYIQKFDVFEWEYINSFGPKKFIRMCNAGRKFEVKLDNNVYFRDDFSCHWNEFYSLRDEFFLKK